jgi:hypothetical protein
MLLRRARQATASTVASSRALMRPGSYVMYDMVLCSIYEESRVKNCQRLQIVHLSGCGPNLNLKPLQYSDRSFQVIFPKCYPENLPDTACVAMSSIDQ